MARVEVLCPDLLFGSRLEGALRAAGHEVDGVAEAEAARDAAKRSDALVVDLTVPEVGGMALGGEVTGVPTLAFYSHVEADTKRGAEEAGFDLVVPRSRMAREATGLVERLLDA